MVRYDIRLYTDRGVRIHGKGVHDRDKGDQVRSGKDTGQAGLRRDGLPQKLSIPGRHEGQCRGRQIPYRIPAPFGE